ncbi:hypothetical protein CANARDRAFT_53103 [[Candida] arabinofermentans NRRL YB-2248]|uniref:Uncharacterized protein n=1 Tax=[Candida] arabinofermentans NRRL YB-2248 TaxID=983967 RepID=A0A1E4T857_9ASCO|nr:hypothetical protein CANARDRAFT_53103 [[Candida] arabinofermentans NRRL YB-2248]
MESNGNFHINSTQFEFEFEFDCCYIYIISYNNIIKSYIYILINTTTTTSPVYQLTNKQTAQKNKKNKTRQLKDVHNSTCFQNGKIRIS